MNTSKLQKGSPATRVVSTSSMLSIGTTISTDTPQQPQARSITRNLTSETYESVLKVVLMEYKNEPRFRARTPSPQNPITRISSPAPSITSTGSRTSHLTMQDKAKNRHSWFGGNSQLGSTDCLPKDALPKLKKVMLDTAMGKNTSIVDPLTKRSFLRLYNDILKPTATVNKVDELIVMFIADATKEIQLVGTESDMKTTLYQQANTFVQVLLGILRTCKHSEDSIKKVLEYQKSMNSKSGPGQLSHSSQHNAPARVQQVSPTYRLNEISTAKAVGDMFGVDELTLQQDVIRLKSLAQEKTLAADLANLRQRLEKNEAVFNPDDFDTTDAYFAWKRAELKGLDEIKQKLSLPQEPPSTSYNFIPSDTRASFSELLTNVLNYELSRNCDSLISNASQTLLDSCSKFWRINSVSFACLLYQAAHISILKDPENELDPERTETLFGVMYRHLSSNGDHDTWPKADKKVWITNLSNTYIQIMTSLRSTLALIYAPKSPKFTPILRILFDFIESDPFYEVLLRSGSPQKWMKRLKNCVLSTTEAKYIELLSAIPRDSTLDLLHIKETAQQIYKNIQLLQKKFPKALLDEIFIANEAGYLFIKLFIEDVRNMLSHIEHYAIKSGKLLSFVDALDTYFELRDLRDIYDQVASEKSKTPFALEKFFFKYLDELADFTSKKFLPVVKESLQHDQFEPLDLENGRGCSSSVLDIFKMTNETFALFRNYEWRNEIQIAYVYTKLLKSLSESLVYYCARVMMLAIEDLQDEPVVNTNESSRKNSANPTWLFNEMKAAISTDSKLTAPPAFSFKMRTCVVLNNLSQMSKLLSDLETTVDPEKIKEMVSGVDTYQKDVNNVFTIRVLRAENIKPCGGDGLSSSYVVLIDTSQRKEIGKTKTIPKTLNPAYEEEFEIETKSASTISISATVWDTSSRVTSQDLCGRALLQLDPNKFRNDGIPEEITRDLDIQGSLVFQVSLESEKDDAIFSIGKAHRSILRTMDKIYSLIAEKFTIFITHSFSRQTLKLICGGNGLRKPTDEECKDAILPLFDYLNSNLQVLAGTLDADLLIKVMLQAWKVVLASADNLLLPALASVKVLNILSNNATWKNSLTNAMANVTNAVTIAGFGRPLTSNEMDCVFIWLNALCEFFYNDGAGPSMEQLKADHYQRLLLIQRHYEESADALRDEVQRLTPLVLKAIKAKNFLGDDKEAVKRSDTIARSKTIGAYGTRRNREAAAQTQALSEKESSLFQIITEDILLRVLLAKDEKEFVNRRLIERERIAKSIATERLARLAVLGRGSR